MKIPKPVEFEWDKGNKDKNFVKHNVESREAEEAFFDENSFTVEDLKHSETEERYQLFAVTKNGRKLTVIFTIRREKLRVISARDMNEKERRFYEKENKIKANS